MRLALAAGFLSARGRRFARWGKPESSDPSFTVAAAETHLKNFSGSELQVFGPGHFATDEQTPEIVRLAEALVQKGLRA